MLINKIKQKLILNKKAIQNQFKKNNKKFK